MLTRRRFFQQSSLAAAAITVAPSLTASAAAPQAGVQVPGVYRRQIGTIEVTALSDGRLDMPVGIITGADPKAVADGLAANFLRTDQLALSLNVFLVNTGSRLILVDSGAGTALGPGAGQIGRALAAAGVSADKIDAVFMTHLHPDHAGGLLLPDGSAAFSKAELLVSEPERAFWADEGIASRAPADMQPFFQLAKAVLAKYAKRTTVFRPGAEVVGLGTVAAFGHTPGHTGVLVASGPEQLLIWGDAVLAPALQFARPEWTAVFDGDPAAAAATRKTLFDRVATDRLLVAGMHHDFPAFGHVAKRGDAYAYVPRPWQA